MLNEARAKGALDDLLIELSKRCWKANPMRRTALDRIG